MCTHTRVKGHTSYIAQNDRNYKLDTDQKHLPFVSVNRRIEENCNPDFKRFDFL